MLKKFKKNESGSVMLETVLVLPLHLILLFGVVWIGTLSFDRLYFSEFSYTMQGADTTAENLQTLFFGENSFVSISGNPESEANGTWWKQTTNGDLKLTQAFPDYLDGFAVLMKELFKASTSDTDQSDTDQSITDPVEFAENGNTSYFKNTAYGTVREAITDAKSLAWLNVAKESFPVGDAVNSNISGTAIAEYTRDPAFAEWSKK